MDKERWSDVRGFEGLYKISTLGAVYSLNYHSTGKAGPLKQEITKDGYRRVALSKGGKTFRFFVHRLVAIAFIPNPFNLPMINHIDENPSNNNINNLEWCTCRYNITYGTSLERGLKTRNKRGRKTGEVPIMQCASNGVIINEFKSLQEASRRAKISAGNICACLKGRRKTSGGYIWKYKSREHY